MKVRRYTVLHGSIFSHTLSLSEKKNPGNLTKKTDNIIDDCTKTLTDLRDRFLQCAVGGQTESERGIGTNICDIGDGTSRIEIGFGEVIALGSVVDNSNNDYGLNRTLPRPSI